MKKKMKGVLFAALLAVAGLFGATASIVNNQVKEKPVVEKVEAATKANVYLKGGWNGWAENDGSKMYDGGTSGSYHVYYAKFTCSAGDGFKINYKIDGGNYWSGKIGSSATTIAKEHNYGNDDATINTGKGGTYVLTCFFQSTSNFWVDNIVTYQKWLTLTKKYSINGSDGGSAGSNQSLDFGASLSRITNPTSKTGYTFKGWYWDVACSSAVSSSGVADGWSSSSGQTATIYAKMEANDMTITKYAVVDGVKVAASIGSDTVKYNQSYAVPSKIYRENCVFGGWYTNEACTTAYTARAITSDMSLYAKYTTHGAWTGTISVDLGGSGWAAVGAHYAMYFMDKTTYPSEVNGWSSYLTYAKDVSALSISYSLPFEPLEISLVRYNPSYSKSSWDSNKWPGGDNAWGQTPDVSFVSFFRVTASVSDSKNAIATTNPTIGRWGPDQSDIALSTRKINGNNHYEYYSSAVVLSAGQQFAIKIDSEAVKNTFATHKSLEGKFEQYYSNIKATEAGTYAMYYDSYTKSVYITTVALAAADEWAQYFLTNVGCDNNGVNLPTGWSACATEYGKLSADAKNIIYGATAGDEGYVPQAVKRYDWAIRSHPSLDHFIVNSSSTPRAAVSNIRSFSPFSIINGEDGGDNTTTIIIIIASSVSLLSITALSVLLVKKRKNKEQ